METQSGLRHNFLTAPPQLHHAPFLSTHLPSVLAGGPPQRDVLLHPVKSDRRCPRCTHHPPNALRSAQRPGRRGAGREGRGKPANGLWRMRVFHDTGVTSAPLHQMVLSCSTSFPDYPAVRGGGRGGGSRCGGDDGKGPPATSLNRLREACVFTEMSLEKQIVARCPPEPES